jgi:phosphoribosylanthranilate isomerase
MLVEVKICGIRSVQDALSSVAAGADAIGINLWPGSKRYVARDEAKKIVEAVGSSALVIAVFVDATREEIHAMRQHLRIQWVQLHGQESPEFVDEFLPQAYKAFAVHSDCTQADVERYPGEHVMLDTASAVGTAPGGTGRTFDWSFAVPIAKKRKLTLAGGLNPDNVAQAVAQVRPFRVDVASGVEKAPGVKDIDRVRDFVKAAKSISILTRDTKR